MAAPTFGGLLTPPSPQKRGAPNASRSLTLEQLSSFFHRPINEVAVEVSHPALCPKSAPKPQPTPDDAAACPPSSASASRCSSKGAASSASRAGRLERRGPEAPRRQKHRAWHHADSPGPRLSWLSTYRRLTPPAPQVRKLDAIITALESSGGKSGGDAAALLVSAGEGAAACPQSTVASAEVRSCATAAQRRTVRRSTDDAARTRASCASVFQGSCR